MKDMRKAMGALIFATGLGMAGSLYAQAVITPYPENENAPLLSPQQEVDLQSNIDAGSVPCEAAPYSPSECGGPAYTGGTVAPELGGTLGSGMDRLPDIPGSNLEWTDISD